MATSNIVPPRKLKGFQDHLAPVERRRQEFMRIIRETADLCGFEPVDTPILEYGETLLGQGGDETDKEVYRFTDHGDRLVALRFDLTVPFARFVAEHRNDLTMPFKRIQIGEVFRGEKPQKGRYRQFCQCDLDIIGADHLAADVDIILSLFRILTDLQIPEFRMVIGHRPLLSALVRIQLGLSSPESETQALIAIDKLDKIGPEKVADLLLEKLSVEVSKSLKLLDLLARSHTAAGLEEALNLLLQSKVDPEEIQRFRETVRILQERTAQSRAGSIVADLSIARGLGYYTGVVFETSLVNMPGFGSISSGGRYNNLVSRFTNQEFPGVGGSIGLDRLVSGVLELEKLAQNSPPRRGTFVAIAEPAAFGYGLEIVEQLRSAGLPCDYSSKQGKLGQQFKLADKRNCAHVITVGSSEQSAGTCNVKDLAAGTEKTGLPLASLVDHLRP